MNTLILTVGLPRSGKSTWAQSTGFPVVCPDAIRIALHGQPFIQQAEPMIWGIAHVMVAALFEAGHTTVILDACSTSSKSRQKWEDGRWVIRHQVFNTLPEVCIQRARDAGMEDLIPVIERMMLYSDPVRP